MLPEHTSFAKLVSPAKKIMTISFDLNTNIYRPLNQVFSFVATPENDFQWQYGTLTSTQISEGEIGIGTVFRSVGHFMGHRIESIYEVTEFEPNKSYGFKSRSGPMDSHTVYTFEVIGGSTKINIFTRISPGDLLKPDNVAMEKKVKKQYRENLALLKGILEADRVVNT
jgi:Polyketide cyclase / dehydrase and lipid transport